MLKLSQVSFGSASGSLSNRKWSGSLFSTVPSDWALGRAAVKLLQVHRWSRVGLVAPSEVRLRGAVPASACRAEPG